MQHPLDGIAIDGLRAHAAAAAGRWGTAAAARTTVGQERAVLRLFGVQGLDRSGRPLASSVADRYLAPDAERLGGGIGLPFAIAMAEYDLGAQELALEVAAGNVDLALEAQLLAQPGRRAEAEAIARGLVRTAMERVDANRLARRELQELLGDPRRPWVGVTIAAPAIVDALDEVRAAIDAGLELVCVDVPTIREHQDRLAHHGVPAAVWTALPSSRGGLEGHDPQGAPVPTGSQRALAVLRRFLDEEAARRRGYVRLMTTAGPLAAPDQAVVAAFERIDLVMADPMGEIASGRVDPARALADHAFAMRLLCRAGASVLVPAGPLVVALDMAAGVPSDPATRSGRALALQLVAVALAVRSGMAPTSVVAGALPPWVLDERDAPARAVAEVAVRRAVLAEHPLAFLEAPPPAASKVTWAALAALLLPDAGNVDLVLRRTGPSVATLATEAIGAAAAAEGMRGTREPARLAGTALEHASRMVAAAEATLEALETRGWSAFVDEPLGLPPAVAAEVVARRDEAFDILATGDQVPA